MNQNKEGGPFSSIIAVRRGEWPLALLMFTQFFLIISTFWVLKPLKKVQFFAYYNTRELGLLGLDWSAAQAELLAKVLNLFVAYVAVVVFSGLSQRFRRERLVFVFVGFFASMFVLYALASHAESAWLSWSFYLFGDLYSSLMVATFFAFLNDSVAPEASRRIYGPVVLGGVLGGAFGTTMVAGWVQDLSLASWLFVCLGMNALIATAAGFAGKMVRAARAKRRKEQDAPPSAPPVDMPNPALEGAKLVFRSRYLLSIVTIVGLYEIVSTVMDFQFSSMVEHYSNLGVINRAQHFATTYAVTNWVAAAVQLFGTSYLMSRYKIGVALMILPTAALGASTAFALFPIVLFGSALNTVDNGLNYSVNQSAKEALYTVTRREEKYAAKAFVDVFVQRFAKALAVFVSLGITLWFKDFESVRYLSGFTLLAVTIWLLATRYASKRFEQDVRADTETEADEPKA